MKRDMEVVRKILLAIEEFPEGTDLHFDLKIGDLDPAVIGEHLRLLVQAKFINGFDHTEFQGEHHKFAVQDLTWEGHEFLDSIRHETTWAAVRAEVTKQGGSLPLELVKALAIAELKKRLGLA